MLIHWINLGSVDLGIYFTLIFNAEPHNSVQKTTKACPKGHKKTPKSKVIGVFSFHQSLIVFISMGIF